MTPLLNPLPIDWTGRSPANRTKGEVHDLAQQEGLPYRIVVMQNGYIYNDPEANLEIMDNRGKKLTENTDYQTLLFSPEIAAVTGKQACALIVVTNQDVGDTLMIDAQMVGGIYCKVNKAIMEQSVNAVVSTNRKIYWRYLTDKPSDFRPSGHLHALWQLYGFTYQTSIIARMTTAKHNEFDKVFQALYDQFNTAFDTANLTLDSAKRLIREHIADLTNPHELTKAVMGLSDVVDGHVATLQEANQTDGSIMYAYATPLRAANSIAVNFTPLLLNHTQNFNNPHKVTAAQLGAVTIAEINTVASPYVNRGETVPYANGVYVAAIGQILSYDQYVRYVRSNIPIRNITNGIFPLSMLSQSNPGDGSSYPSGSDSYLVGGFSGYLQPLKLSAIWNYWISYADN